MKKEKKIIRRFKVGQTGRRQRKKEEENYLGSRSIREVGHEKRKKGEEIIYNTVPEIFISIRNRWPRRFSTVEDKKGWRK